MGKDAVDLAGRVAAAPRDAMSELIAKLNRLLSVIRASGSPLADHLRPGLPRAEVAAAVAALGLAAPDELLDLFTWHDGVDSAALRAAHDPIGRPHLFPFVDFVPLATGLATYEMFVAENVIAEVWPRRLFPILDGETFQYAVGCDADAADYGVVWAHDVSDPGTSEAAFWSIGSLVEAVTAMFADGSYYFDFETHDIQPQEDAYLRFDFGA